MITIDVMTDVVSVATDVELTKVPMAELEVESRVDEEKLPVPVGRIAVDELLIEYGAEVD